jgi:hypothetical protein
LAVGPLSFAEPSPTGTPASPQSSSSPWQGPQTGNSLEERHSSVPSWHAPTPRLATGPVQHATVAPSFGHEQPGEEGLAEHATELPSEPNGGAEASSVGDPDALSLSDASLLASHAWATRASGNSATVQTNRPRTAFGECVTQPPTSCSNGCLEPREPGKEKTPRFVESTPSSRARRMALSR